MSNTAILRGVYFLANDNVLELAIAFLRSFRYHNPHIPLCLIPFDADHNKVAALREAYNFSIYPYEHHLEVCDDISKRFHGRVVGAYRKLAAWDGIFESFAYIDIDTVVTQNIDFAFAQSKHAAYIASHSNLDNIRKWVWKDSIYQAHVLTTPQIAYAANTGFFVSARGVLSMNDCLQKLEGALLLKDHMELHCMEQPFLNYLVVTSGCSYTSLLSLRQSGVVPDLPAEFWAGIPGARVQGGTLYDLRGVPAFLVHWAGIWQNCGTATSDFPYRELWQHYRRADIPADVSVVPAVCEVAA